MVSTTTESASIARRLGSYCSALCDDGVSYGDYVEQLTYLLFLKMADEQVRGLGDDDDGAQAGVDRARAG